MPSMEHSYRWSLAIDGWRSSHLNTTRIRFDVGKHNYGTQNMHNKSLTFTHHAFLSLLTP